MADLGSKKISSNYQKLLQKDENGMVADGSGSLITLNLSGSKYYTSGSTQVLSAINVTGSIVPEGGTKWDLGSPTSPFRHLFVSEQSITFVNDSKTKGDAERSTKLTKSDIQSWLEGDFSTKVDSTTKQRLVSPIASTIRTSGVEPFVWDENDDLVSNNLTSMHIVSDKFWVWNSTLSELEPKSIMFAYAVDSSPSNDLVIGGN